MGCRSCVAACAVENHFTPDAPWNVMIEYEVGTYPSVKKVFNTMNCMHCEKPACKAACDAVGAKAISKNEFGVVLIDYDKCIGCGHCVAVCPYGVPQFNKEVRDLNPGKGKIGAEQIAASDRHPTHRKKAKVVEKCTFCWHKLEKAIADDKIDQIGKAQEYTPSLRSRLPGAGAHVRRHRRSEQRGFQAHQGDQGGAAQDASSAPARRSITCSRKERSHETPDCALDRRSRRDAALSVGAADAAPKKGSH